MELVFNECERRVLGVLIEKSLTQPENYPLTSNAVVAACNQKSNRDPVLDLDENTVLKALDQLRERGLVTLLFPAPGARTNRFRHEIEEQLGWVKAERAVIAELLLRGPQTAGELRSRAGRMSSFANLDALTELLDRLAQKDPPLAAQLPRESGRSAVRYTHLLYPQDEQPTPATHGQTPAAAAASAGGPANLRGDLEALRQEVQDLRERLENIEKQLL